MFASFSLPFTSAFFSSSRSSSSAKRAISIPSVEIHDIESAADKRAQSLKQFLKANHTNYSIIYNHLRFHNHNPHILGSAYILGASTEQLTRNLRQRDPDLETWVDAPGEISAEDWRDYLGKREYQRAWVDFFEDQLVGFGYDWRALLDHYLYTGDRPLFNGLVEGLAHPLIHLAYSYELSSRTVAIEALGLIACFYGPLHKYLDDTSYTRPSSYKTSSVLDILNKVAQDERLNTLHLASTATEEQALDAIIASHEEIILDHWNALGSLLADRAICQLAKGRRRPASRHCQTLILKQGQRRKTTLRLLPLPHPHILSRYARPSPICPAGETDTTGRPKIDLSLIENVDKPEHGWKEAIHLAVDGEHSTDAHYVKAIRAMREAAQTWGDDDSFYLKAGTKFAKSFDGWASSIFAPLVIVIVACVRVPFTTGVSVYICSSPCQERVLLSLFPPLPTQSIRDSITDDNVRKP
ncbi:hypothetical protein MRB53_042224 [Persea americana]|nr:hypothetical protein MRB53_042224 [Persea americana]